MPPCLVIVGDLNIIRSFYVKSEADAPLVVYPDAPLTGPLAGKCLKAIAGRKPNVVNRYSGIKLGQPYHRPLLNILRQPAGFLALRQTLSLLAFKRPDHVSSINILFILVNELFAKFVIFVEQ